MIPNEKLPSFVGLVGEIFGVGLFVLIQEFVSVELIIFSLVSGLCDLFGGIFILSRIEVWRCGILEKFGFVE